MENQNQSNELSKIEGYLKTNGFKSLFSDCCTLTMGKGNHSITIVDVDNGQVATGDIKGHFIFSKMFSKGLEDFKIKTTGFPLFFQINNV